MLLAFKEDSPPAALDLEHARDARPGVRFNGQLKSKTFTAHPKLDSHTGNMVAFGYEAKGFNTTDVNVFEYTPQGKKVWDAWVNVPYVGMLHDFAGDRELRGVLRDPDEDRRGADGEGRHPLVLVAGRADLLRLPAPRRRWQGRHSGSRAPSAAPRT